MGGMIGECAPGIKRKKHFCHWRAVEKSLLAMAVLSRMRFGAQLFECRVQIENMALSGKAFNRSWP